MTPVPEMLAPDTFVPGIGCSNRHVQTLLPVFLGMGLEETYTWEEVTLPDGDFVDLAWRHRPHPGTTRPIVILFHGLEGSAASPYAVRMMRALGARGWHGMVMHFRGCSGRDNRLPRSYHSGDTGDARYVIDLLGKQYPQAPLAAVGYSIGGNMLLKLAGEMGEALPLSAVVSVSAPLQLDMCADYIRLGFSRIYQHHLMQRMKRKLLRRFSKHDYTGLIGLRREDVSPMRDFWDFDDAYTAPIHGFTDARDYYTRASAIHYLDGISVPTMLIHAQDDPFMPPDVLPSQAGLSANIQLAISNRGGHVGFVSGSLFQPRFWLEERVPAFLDRFLG